MTAEIAIMNQEAIALAADSAVTIGDQNAPKIYPSANKVFMLSKYQPVGIMIYNNSEFLNIHWETIIKIYREELQDQSFKSLYDYSNHFLYFIQNNRHLFPKYSQDEFCNYLIINIFTNLHKKIWETLFQKFKSKKDTNKEELEIALENVINTNFNAIKQNENIKDLDDNKLSDEEIKQIHDYYKHDIKRIKNKIFNDVPLNKSMSNKITRIGKYALTKILTSDIYSGLVIAGYGNDDVFPALISYNIEGIVCNYLKYNIRTYDSIRSDNRAEIFPFAQKDMIHTFVEGIDPNYKTIIYQSIHETFNEYFDTLANDIFELEEENPERKKLHKIARQSKDKLIEILEKNKRERFIQPLLEILESLPKTELANMAETMVNLTSFKRKMSKKAETVGGPIDVALISKGDGFVWIKRKHYFNPELNYHFFQNYFKENNNEEENE